MITTHLTPGLETTPLGFGCADLFRLPSARARRALLDAALEAGVRHFDVAPMYGLGAAERELGAFARNRRHEVVIATKFGIRPTLVSKSVSLVQGPIRALLAAAPNARNMARSAAPGPSSGSAGSLLYRSDGYGSRAAQASLEHSLRQLGTDHVDLLLLHDPVPGQVDSDDTRAYLEQARTRGLIRAWGVAGEARPSVQVAETLLQPDQVIQLRDDLIQRQGLAASAAPPLLPRISFGVLGRVLGLLQGHARSDPALLRAWNDELGIDCAEVDQLGGLLFREAFDANPTGVTLFTTTRPERIGAVVAACAAHRGRPDEAVVALRRLAAPVVASAIARGDHR